MNSQPASTINVEPTQWRCNGGIDPLLTSREQALKICNNEEDLVGLLWSCVIHLGQFPNSLRFRQDPFYTHKRISEYPHQYLHLIDDAIKSGLQRDFSPSIEKVFVNGKTYPCNAAAIVDMAPKGLFMELSLLEMQYAVQQGGSFNEFDSIVVSSVLGTMFNGLQYFNPNNPNNGSPFFRFAWSEASVHIIRDFWKNPNYILSEDKKTASLFTPEMMFSKCQAMAKVCKADECRLIAYEDKTMNTCHVKLWWD